MGQAQPLDTLEPTVGMAPHGLFEAQKSMAVLLATTLATH
jgi:hypothetical protein